MLDAKADGKGLGFQRHAARQQNLEHVAGAVTHRQHGMAGKNLFAAFQFHAFYGPVLDQKIGDLALEAVFAAQALDGGAHRFHHRHQAEGADMGMGFGEDFFRGAGLDEFLQHLAAEMARILDLAVELAVGKSAGAAFAELDVRLRLEHALPP